MLEQMPKENFRMAEAKWPVCQEEAQTGRCEGPLGAHCETALTRQVSCVGDMVREDESAGGQMISKMSGQCVRYAG
jgi:hypothetical protein